MKKTAIRLCAAAMIGLALTACGGHHDSDADRDRDANTQTVIDTVGANHPEEKEHKEHSTTGGEEPQHHHEHSDIPTDTVRTGSKGSPKVDTADAEKPGDAGSMGNASATRHHVKPGGLQGGK